MLLDADVLMHVVEEAELLAEFLRHRLPLGIATTTVTHPAVYTVEQAKEQLLRAVRPAPTVKLNPAQKNLFEFRFEDVTLEGYDPHPAIKAPVAV